jgi:uncharacterized protein (UPF0335 family)
MSAVTIEEAEAISDVVNNFVRSERSNSIAADRLQNIVSRIERLEEERKALSSDIKDIYTEAKSSGFNTKVLRQLMRIRKQDAAEVDEQEALLDTYRRVLGM